MSIFCVEEPLGPWGEELKARGVPIHSVRRRDGFDWRVVSELRKVLRDENIDVVHCHQYTPWVYGALAALGKRTRVVFTEHGRFYPDFSSSKRRFVNPLLARITDRVTAISKATREALTTYEYLPASRIEVIYNGIVGLSASAEMVKELRETHGIPETAVVLGSIARLDPIKNHAMMLNAFAAVLKEFPQAYLLLVGDGEERGNIERLVQELGIGARVVMPGYVPQPTNWLAAMDVFLLSSFSEGTSMTLLEAMSLAKPCVVTKVGGNPEIVMDGQTGFVSPNDDAVEFSRSIMSILSSDTMRQRLASAARERFAAAFDARRMADRYMDCYQSCASHL